MAHNGWQATGIEHTHRSLERGRLVERRQHIVHVWPVDDMRTHEGNRGTRCWCSPTVEAHPGGTLVGHHAMDGRELIEAHGVM